MLHAIGYVEKSGAMWACGQSEAVSVLVRLRKKNQLLLSIKKIATKIEKYLFFSSDYPCYSVFAFLNKQSSQIKSV